MRDCTRARALGQAVRKHSAGSRRTPAPACYETCGRGTPGRIYMFFFQAEDGIRDLTVTGVQTCALPILTRLQNHASLLGFLLSDMGAWGTPLMYAFREREKILDLFESLSGSRMMCDYMRFGGCRCDTPPGWIEQAKKIVDRVPRFIHELEQLVVGNEIVIRRTQNVGVLSPELAINAGITGPMLRACGVNYDIRKVDGYGFYPRFKFRIPLGEHGDTYDRLMLRVLEMRESLSILQQAFAQIQPGPIVNPKVKIRAFRPPAGEAYGRIEGPKGELGFYLISDGGPNPYRYRFLPPSFINLTVLEDLCLGHTVADVMVILGSVDIVMGEVDR